MNGSNNNWNKIIENGAYVLSGLIFGGIAFFITLGITKSFIASLIAGFVIGLLCVCLVKNEVDKLIKQIKKLF